MPVRIRMCHATIMLPLLAACIATACATRGGIEPLGPDTYYLSREGALYADSGALKTETLKEAGQYCGRRKMEIIMLAEENIRTLLFAYPRVDVKFRCANK